MGRTDGYGNNLVPLLNADFTPLCGGGAAVAATRRGEAPLERGSPLPGPASAGPGQRRALPWRRPPRRGSLSGKRAKVPLDCNLTSGCKGKLLLRAARGRARLGDSRFKVNSGDRRTVKVKLSKKGKRKARGKRALKVRTKVKVKGGPNETKKIKLKR